MMVVESQQQETGLCKWILCRYVVSPVVIGWIVPDLRLSSSLHTTKTRPLVMLKSWWEWRFASFSSIQRNR